MSFNLQSYLAAGYSGIMIYGSEDKRIISDINAICKVLSNKTGKPFDMRVWTVANGWQDNDTIDLKKEGASTINDIKDALKQMLSFRNSGCYCLVNFHFFIKDPGIIQIVKEIIYKWKDDAEEEGKHLIFIENVLTIPPELEKEITVLDYELPNRGELENVLKNVITDTAGNLRIKELSESHKDKILSSALGMTYLEAENAFALSLIEKDLIDVDIINREKGQILKKSGLLELFPSTETLDDVGGLENLKEWVRKRTKAFTPEARAFGITPPRGIILAGVSGSGKSLSAKAIAHALKQPLIRVDMGKAFGSLVGQSLPAEEEVLVYRNDTCERWTIGTLWQKQPDAAFVDTFTDYMQPIRKKITGYYRHKLETSLLKITTKMGREITVTEDHNLFILNNGLLQAIPTTDLIVGNFIALPLGAVSNGNVQYINLLDFCVKNKDHLVISANSVTVTELANKLPKYLVRTYIEQDSGVKANEYVSWVQKDEFKFKLINSDDYINSHLVLSNDFCELLGWWLAEGDIGDNRCVRFSVAGAEVDHLMALAKRAGINAKYYGRVVFLSSKLWGLIWKYLELWGLSHEKRIPAWIFGLSKEQIAAFLRGYFTGDGGIVSGRTIEATTVSRLLANDIAYILAQLGVIAKVSSRKNTHNRYAGAKEIYYRLTISNTEAIRRFATTIGFCGTKQNALQNVLRVLQNRKMRGLNTGYYIPMVASVREEMRKIRNKLYFLHDGKDIRHCGKKTGTEYVASYGAMANVDTWLRDAPKWNVYWDEVVSISKVAYQKYVYDISIADSEKFISGFGGVLVHNSEERARMITKQLDAMAPCVPWIDEAEKGFAGTKSGGITDSGVTMRVLGTFLTWLAETKYPIFCVMTVNNVELLPPELLRKGRFDELFFVDLPNSEERKQIFKIHLRKRGRLVKNFDIEALSKASDGYVGSEIEEAIKSGLFDAFDIGREVVTDDIITAIGKTVPLSKTMEKEVAALRQWADQRAVKASKPSVDIKVPHRRINNESSTFRSGINSN